jgi:hypothetical protein
MLTKKGQISIEILIIVGIIIMISVLFATYYLSSVNRNIEDTTVVPDDNSVDQLSTNSSQITYTTTSDLDNSLCGNGVIDPREVCDTQPLGTGTFPTGMTCADIGSIGILICINNCTEISCN